MVLSQVKLLMWRTNSMPENIDFEKEMKRLDEIVAKISSQDLPLDECLALYQEGQKIIKSLEKALEEAKDKVEKVIETK